MQNDLISRSALIKTLEDEGLGDHSLIESVLAAGVYAKIENAPPVDAVEVVRCKDCKFHRKAGCPMRALHVAPYGYKIHDNTTENSFCHMGKKMDLQEVEAGG